MAYITLTHEEQKAFEFAYVEKNRKAVIETIKNSRWNDCDFDDDYEIVEYFFDMPGRWLGVDLPLESYYWQDWDHIGLIGDEKMTVEEIREFASPYLPEDFPYESRMITDIKYAPDFDIFMEDLEEEAADQFDMKCCTRKWIGDFPDFEGERYAGRIWERWSRIKLDRKRCHKKWLSNRGSDFAVALHW